MAVITGKLKETGGSKIDRIKASMDSLVSLQDLLEKESASQGCIKNFSTSFSSLMIEADNVEGLGGYIADCLSYAERGRLDGFEEACWRRSALQLLDDYFIDQEDMASSRFKSLLQEDLNYIDETLRNVSDDAPPVREEDIPVWANERHWWWRAPKQQDMSDDEIKSRLEYDFWDGVQD